MARKEKQYHFIYKTTNLLNGKYYYGMHSTDNLNDGYYGSGKRLKYSINKYGKENHIVVQLEFLPDRKSLIEREKLLIDLNEVAKEKCMNLRIGGSGGLLGLPEETIKRIRKGASEFMTNLWKDKNFIDGHVKRSSRRMKWLNETHVIKHDTFTNKKHTDETKRLMSVKASKHIGDKNSQYGTCWVTKDGINKKIKNNDLLMFTNNGWHKGRII
jgi:hypothetical protein